MSQKVLLSNQLCQGSCKILGENHRKLEIFCIYIPSQISLGFTCDILKKLKM